MSRRRCDCRISRRRRRGIVLVLVLVIVAILILAVYQFADSMIAHMAYVRTDHRYDAESLLAHSAAECVLAGSDSAAGAKPPEIRVTSSIAGGTGSSVRADGLDGDFSIYHFSQATPLVGTAPGLSDESCKLNLNCLPLEAHHQSISRQALLHVPKMTASLADSILDWLDADEVTRPLGAESSYYSSLSPPFRAANRRLASLDELLLVRGVTRELLYGTAAPEDERVPGHGPELGWNRFLTVLSCERNVDHEGRPRIDLNDPQLSRLYDRLSTRLPPQQSRFIVALRLAGPWRDGKEDSRANIHRDEMAAVRKRIKEQTLTPTEESLSAESPQDSSRGGLDLSQRPVFRLRSLADLWGTKVRILAGGRDELLTSPWQDSPAALRSLINELSDFLSTQDAAQVAGRVNINLAPPEVLRAIPGMPVELADSIHARQRDMAGRPWADRLPNRATLAWLLEEGLMNPATLRDLAPYLTCRGDVLQGYVACRVHQADSAGCFRMIVNGSRFPAAVQCLQYLGELPAPLITTLFRDGEL